MQDFEKLGVFYLGRTFDLERGQAGQELILYDAKDLTTHGVIVGMTGSGKTGLAISLLEEAAIDAIPVIAIDPKGDLANLLLTFPQLRPSDFQPWLDPGDASRRGKTVEQLAQTVADTWRNGLASWGQDGERIARFQNAAEAVIYTPGSSAGIPLTVFRSFAAPPAAVVADEDALRERILSAVSGLLALLGIDADPLRSREHILLSNLLSQAWRNGENLDMAGLIRGIQNPPFSQVGVFDLESFYPSSQRFDLAVTLNNILASPGFAAWLQGEPLDVQRLLYTPAGKPKISVISIAHLSDTERMFFVTLLLNEVISWMRAQPGTQSLRALLYMDEVFGFFPPTANPPAKRPMLTLLKQARAFGLGVVLATQNPVDLDYKGLSNAGTWFIGRLQTERDKARVLDGLEGASASAGQTFDRGRMEQIISGLGNRVFLMNNVHEDEPVLFQTRWALSFLAGPVTREKIKLLMEPRQPSSSPAPSAPMIQQPVESPAPRATIASIATAPAVNGPLPAARPLVPPEIREGFWPPDISRRGASVRYTPALLAISTLHYVSVRDKIDEWQRAAVVAPIGDDDALSPWEQARDVSDCLPDLDSEPLPGAEFVSLPPAAANPKSYSKWSKMLETHLFSARPLRLFRCPELKTLSRPGESLGDFRIRLRDMLREKRDDDMEKLRRKYAPKLQMLQDQIRRAEDRVAREEAQSKQQKISTALSVGSSVLSAIFGRKLASAANVGRAASAMRTASRTSREREDVARAQENLAEVQRRLRAAEDELSDELAKVRGAEDPFIDEREQEEIAPRKGDIQIERIQLVWLPK